MCAWTAGRSAPATAYRVAVNNYLASGGDDLFGFTAGTDITDKGIIDLDALVALDRARPNAARAQSDQDNRSALTRPTGRATQNLLG